MLEVVPWVLVLLFAIGYGALLWRAGRSPWELVVSRRVVVNLKSGQAIDGVLVRQQGPLLFLRNAALLTPGSDPVPFDGEIVVERVEVEFLQAP